jgi:hypothetical protein
MNDVANKTVTSCHALNLSQSLLGNQLVSSATQLKLNCKTVPGDKLSLGLFAVGNKLCPKL